MANSTSELIAFLSVDVVGSTAYKNSFVRKENHLEQPWLSFFKEFYSSFQNTFTKYIDKCDGENIKSDNLRVWKSLGDELIFIYKIDKKFNI